MSGLDWNSLAPVDAAEQRRRARKEQQARREARYDLSHGTTIAPVDADTNARLAAKPLDRVYWTEYAHTLRAARLN